YTPKLANSKLNEYSDIRNNFYIRKATINLDDVFGKDNYLKYGTQRSFYNNQSHLATYGQYGRYKVQFRYDEIPHIYSNSVRTAYAETQPGVFTLPGSVRQALQTASSTGTAAQINNNLPSTIQTQLVPNQQSFVPKIQRRAGTGLINYNLTPAWN